MSLAADIPAHSAEQLLNIIIVNDFAEVTGGADKVALAEAAGLAGRGHCVSVVAGHGRPDPELLAAGVNVEHTRQQTTLDDPNRLRAATRGIWNRPAAAVVQQVAQRSDPHSTVIHVHGFTKVLSTSVVRAAVRSGVPIVATLHDYFAACPNGGFFDYQRNEVCRRVPLSPDCILTNCDARAYPHKVWRVARAAVQRGVGAMPDGVRHFIVPSAFAATVLKPFLPTSAQVHVVSNPVGVNREQPADVAKNKGFVFVGRLQRDKDPVTFARAARRSGVRATFIGSGDDADVVAQACPGAELTGWLDPGSVRSRIRSARALVCPSSWYEVQPLVPLEAAAQGVPAIVSDAGAFRDAVADEQTGLWFSSGDVDDLVLKLERLEKAPELAERLGRNAYEQFWSRDWTIDTHLSRLESIYSAALAG